MLPGWHKHPGGPINKIAFVLQRRANLDRATALAEWTKLRHTCLVLKIPGLMRYVQNRVVSAGEPVGDGIGEFWFDDADTLQAALSSAELATASQDATRFLDMERTALIVLDELTVLG